jgi:hypothetical protein
MPPSGGISGPARQAAARHPGYDRLVFTFRGGVPKRHTVRYVSQVIADPSGLPVNVAGSAKLLVTFTPGTGHSRAR